MDDHAARLMAAYPRIFFACHRRHVRDPKTRRRLSAHQGSIIDHLDTVTPMTLNALAEHMGVTPGTMSVAVERLVKMGYIQRKRDRLDARRVQLRLTRAGERIKEAQSVLDPELVAELLAGLDDARREQALAGLEVMAEAAGGVIKARKERRAWRAAAQSETGATTVGGPFGGEP